MTNIGHITEENAYCFEKQVYKRAGINIVFFNTNLLFEKRGPW